MYNKGIGVKMSEYFSRDVFIPGGMPQFTYIPRPALRLEDKLLEIRTRSNKFISVTGNTKSGKTVLVRKIFPEKNSIWFEGGSYTDEVSFWDTLCDKLDLFTNVVKSSENTFSTSGELEAEGKLGFFASLKAKLNLGRSLSNTASLSRKIPSKNVVISMLKENKIPIIIDDFHYIQREDQKKILRALKPVIFNGLPIILISIPHRKFDIIKAERELTGRIEQILVPAWQDDELAMIAQKGFPLLNMEVEPSVIRKFVDQAIGSPHLMQDICLELCKSRNVISTLNDKSLIQESNESLFKAVAENSGRAVFDKLMRGPRKRTDRKIRKLKNGQSTDIYGAILFAFSSMKPGIETLDYDQIRGALRKVLASEMPQSSEISRILEKMATISSGDNVSTPVVDWEKSEQLLHITDPFFSFYLRWGNLFKIEKTENSEVNQ